MPALSSGPITADHEDASAQAACTRTIVAFEGTLFIIHLSPEPETHAMSDCPAAEKIGA
jgi:hypothetical protein